ncbi:MAG: hypothetical protein C0412_21270 [Flavobacterium sp.]|nr:hypothetical protein [Flavobacterium sp.]
MKVKVYEKFYKDFYTEDNDHVEVTVSAENNRIILSVAKWPVFFKTHLILLPQETIKISELFAQARNVQLK